MECLGDSGVSCIRGSGWIGVAPSSAGRRTRTRARHHVADRRHARFVPADASVERIGAGIGNGAGFRSGFLCRHAVFDQIERGDAKNGQKSRTDARSGSPDDFDREAQSVLERPARSNAARLFVRSDVNCVMR